MPPKNPTPTNNSQEQNTKTAKVILNGDAHELRPVFDFCTQVSGDVHPKSATQVGDTKAETIQTKYYPQIFNILKDTKFFKERMTKLLGESDYLIFLDFVDKVYKNDESVKEISKEIIEKIVHATIKFCADYQDDIQPIFEFETDEEMQKTQFKNSDIIVNLINNINTKAQVVEMGM